MKKIAKISQEIALAISLVLCINISLKAQQVLYQEDFGTPTTATLIQNYHGWQNNSVRYYGNGTCDVRSSSASSGYGIASGGGNVMINDTVKWFMVAGINTLADTNLSLYCGLKKTAAENGSHFVVEASQDSTIWTRLELFGDTLPTGTGTSGWHRIRYTNVPSCQHLYIRFSNLSTVDFRIDDLALVVGEEAELETVATPTFTPGSGTYYEPKEVTVTTATAGARIFYTMDGSTPTEESPEYLGTLTINNTVTLKVLATHASMYNSAVATATYVIIDTNSLVELPFDISNNSTGAQQDITTMPGFRGYHLGSSYADGSVKFEASHAGEAALVAHLDSAPGRLSFDLKGKKGGSNPSAYEDVTMEISQSVDGRSWHTVALLNNEDIIIDNFVTFNNFTLDPSTRFIRWRLLSASKGNTQLNNIAIAKYTEPDTTSVAERSNWRISIFPNPTHDEIHISTRQHEITGISLHDLSGRLLLERNGNCESPISLRQQPAGVYILRIFTPEGTLHKKILKY